MKCSSAQIPAADCTSCVLCLNSKITPKCKEVQKNAGKSNPYLQVSDKRNNSEKSILISQLNKNWDIFTCEQRIAIKSIINAMIPKEGE